MANNILTQIEKLPKPSDFSFPGKEKEILNYWNDIKAFESSLKQSEGKPEYTFYDGPPFATGLPHYGHILAGTIKDVVTRFQHSKGFHVKRVFGWDCHGLPIEFEIEKEHGIKTKEQVLEWGIENYNNACRKIVMKYSEEWKVLVNRLGRWIDMENNYKTMDFTFMESVWWVFKQLWEKGSVYRGEKIMPYSTGCTTVLSNFEASSNYKEVNDPEVYVLFQSADDPNLNYIAWTTTPWTLPSNLALCVHPEMKYVKVLHNESGKHYILLESKVSSLFKRKKDKNSPSVPEYKILEEFTGSDLKGKKYIPLFDYFKESYPNAFEIINDTYVTDESGTGIVHQAPGFGESDYNACLKSRIITKDVPVPCPIDESGRFTSIISNYKGMYVKDTDESIVKELKSKGRVFRSGTVKHNYPFCWRSNQPLIYCAKPSWFVRVEDIREKLMKNNLETKWVPEFVQTKRFHNWLEGARDWAISRTRYWGTPIPIWTNSDFSEMVVIGSVKELEELSGKKITDLHRENVDCITIPSKILGGEPLRRVEDVFDCWFESGSMPYAQKHYPFEDAEKFKNSFPADFIAEGIDQTRGWFYTLLVLSTLLFDKPPFKNLIVNGLVLAENGKKMSKSLKNYPDPNIVIDKYGSDALRMYLISSPVVRGENLCFKEDGVKGIVREVLLPWYNNLRFLLQSIQEYEVKTNSIFVPKPLNDDNNYGKNSHHYDGYLDNIFDKWIYSETQRLVGFVSNEMESYRLYSVLSQLVKFINDLNNWYLRSNRARFRSQNGQKECYNALNTLFDTLLTLSKLMSPFTPFFSEFVYQKLCGIMYRNCTPPKDSESIHYLSYPKVQSISTADSDVLEAVNTFQSIVELGRLTRERRKIPHRQPLRDVHIVLKNDKIQYVLENQLHPYLLEELNVKYVSISSKHSMVKYVCSPNFSVLGKRLLGDMKSVMSAINSLTQVELESLFITGKIEILGHEITSDDLRITSTFSGNCETHEPSNTQDLLLHPNVSIVMNVEISDQLASEGIVRHLIHAIQRMRKLSGVSVLDKQNIYYSTPEGPLLTLLDKYKDFIESRIKRSFSFIEDPSSNIFNPNDYKIEKAYFTPDTPRYEANTVELILVFN